MNLQLPTNSERRNLHRKSDLAVSVFIAQASSTCSHSLTSLPR